MFRVVVCALFVSLASAASAQSVVGENANNHPTPFKDTSLLKPPPGAKVAIVEWEDLECPSCSHAFPIVHAAVDHYHIPLVRRDFPLAMHIWSRQAAIIARYIQDKISPSGAEEYRREVFASQYQIASKEDLQRFTEKFLASNHHQMPFVIDPTGQFAKEVDADEMTAEKAGLNHTPTIVVVTPTHWTEVLDISDLYSAIDAALAQTANSAPAHRTVAAHKKAS